MTRIKLNYASGKKKWQFLGKAQKPFFILLTLIIFGIGPIIADQISTESSSSSNTETTTVLSEVSPTPIPETSESPTPESTEQPNSNSENTETASVNESGTSSVAPSPTKIPPHAVSNQNIKIQIPRVQRVDPRAKFHNLPQVNFYSEGSPFLMLCINSSYGNLDVETKGIDDSFSGKDIFINGDLSTSLQISGTSNQVLNVFNSFGGLRVKGPDGRSVVGTYLWLRFVAISEPTDNFALCAESATASQWGLEIQPLGLTVTTKKNPLNLGDKRN